jgi:CHAD domain-containing protein
MSVRPSNNQRIYYQGTKGAQVKAKLDESTCRFGTGVLLKHSQALQQEIEGVRLGQDIEYIHRMRVASRRLRSALPIFAGCFSARKISAWTREVKQITVALGNARDTDVQIDLVKQILASLPSANMQNGVRRLLLRFSQQRMKLQSKVLLAVDELTGSGILADMTNQFNESLAHFPESLPNTGSLYQLGFDTLNLHLDEFLAYEKYIYAPERVAELHAMRIASKRLRYEMEIFAPLYPEELKSYMQAIRKAQETLGNVHDCDVWALTLPQFMEKERRRSLKFYGSPQPYNRLIRGIQYFQQNRETARKDQYEMFLDDWQKWKTLGFWEEFRNVIRRPLSMVDRVFPVSGFPNTPEAQVQP